MRQTLSWNEGRRTRYGKMPILPFAEKSEAPRGTRRYERPAALWPSVAVQIRFDQTFENMILGPIKFQHTIKRVAQDGPVIGRVLTLVREVSRNIRDDGMLTKRTFKLLSSKAEESAATESLELCSRTPLPFDRWELTQRCTEAKDILEHRGIVNDDVGLAYRTRILKVDGVRTEVGVGQQRGPVPCRRPL